MTDKEPLRVARVSIVGGKVHLAVCKTKRGQGTVTKSTINRALTRVYEKRGKTGVDNEILKQVAEGKMKLIGNHHSIKTYKEILSIPENAELLSEEHTDILIDERETEDEYTGTTYAIKMNGDDYLCGVLSVKTGDLIQYVPYGKKDMPLKPIKYFLLREQARAYMEQIKKHCENFFMFRMEIVEKTDKTYVDGVQKIAGYCERRKAPLTMPKKPVIDKDRDVVIRTYRFPNREYTLDVELYKHQTIYKLYRRKTLLCESTRQIDIIQELPKYKIQGKDQK